MSVDQAAYSTVHDPANGGPKVVAAKLEMKHQVLLNKVNLNNDTHYLYLSEAVNLMRVTSDTRIIEAFANEFGGVFVPVQGWSGASNLIGDLADTSAKFGELMRGVADGLADGVVSDNELAEVEREAAKLREALAVLLRDLRGINRAGHPKKAA